MESRACLKVTVFLLIVTAAPVLSGCQTALDFSRSADRPALARTTYIVHLPGIGGRTGMDLGWVRALGTAKVADHLEVYDWTKPYSWIGSLRAYRHNRAEARVVANHIAAKLRDDPAAQIILTSWSGGCQIAIWALEDLPENVTVRSVVMIAPAIRPDYDLSRALAHVKGSLFACTSPGDWFILGWGTRVFGTSDGAKVKAAGLVGFAIPPGADRTGYRKLVQLRYALSWLRYGNIGDHNGAIGRGFAKEILAPKLIADNEQ